MDIGHVRADVSLLLPTILTVMGERAAEVMEINVLLK